MNNLSMNNTGGLRFLKALSAIDDDLLSEADNGLPVRRHFRSAGAAAGLAAAAAAAAGIGLYVYFSNAPAAAAPDGAESSLAAPAADSSQFDASSVISGPEESEEDYRFDVDDRIFLGYDQLIEEADIIMIGEYLEDGEPANKKFLYGGHTYNTLKAVQVFKGEEKLGEDGTIRICEPFAYRVTEEGEEQLLAREIAPRGKGDRMIFLLKYSAELGVYVHYGPQGRFPLPEDLNKADKNGYINGLIDSEEFQYNIYSRLISDYDIK